MASMRRPLATLAVVLTACGAAPAHGIVDAAVICKDFGNPGVLVILHATDSEPSDALAAVWDVPRCPTHVTEPPVAGRPLLNPAGVRAGGVRLFASFAPNGIPLEESSASPGQGYSYGQGDARLTCPAGEIMLVRVSSPDFDVPIASPPPIAVTAPACANGRCGAVDVSQALDLRWTPAGDADAFVDVTIDVRSPDAHGYPGERLESCAVPARGGGAQFALGPRAQGKVITVTLQSQTRRLERRGGWVVSASALGARQRLDLVAR